jgi:hypothetical protein
LGKRRNGTPESGGHGGGNRRVSVDRDKGTFVKIDSEPNSGSEFVKNIFKIGNVFRDGANDNEGVVGVLEDRTGEVFNKRVEKEPIPRGLEQKLLENVCDNVEEEGERGSPCRRPRRHWIHLPRTSLRRTSVWLVLLSRAIQAR